MRAGGVLGGKICDAIVLGVGVGVGLMTVLTAQVIVGIAR